jgi:hypothetical protein
MGERRLVHALIHDHDITGSIAGRPDRLRRLVACRDRVAALLRAGRRADPPAQAATYRSSYAARLWAMSEAAQLAPSDRPQPRSHLSLVEPDEDS